MVRKARKMMKGQAVVLYDKRITEASVNSAHDSDRKFRNKKMMLDNYFNIIAADENNIRNKCRQD